MFIPGDYIITYVKMYCNLVAISTASWLRTFLCVLSLALLLVGLPGHLLHHVGALLPGHGDTLLASSIGTFLLVNVFGHGGGSVLTDLLGSVAAHLARSVHVIANLRQRIETKIVKNNNLDFTCLDTGLHFWLFTTEHCCSLISLVRILGIRVQTRRDLGWQSWTGTS